MSLKAQMLGYKVYGVLLVCVFCFGDILYFHQILQLFLFFVVQN